MKLALTAALILTLAACATKPLVPPNLTVPVAQADTSIDALYNVTAGYYVAHQATMDPATKATAKGLLLKAYPFVAAADAAEVLGDAATVAAQIKSATDLIGQAKTAMGEK